MVDERIRKSQELIIEVFRSFRGELMGCFGAFEFERKDDSSPVTECDKLVENELKNRLAEDFPDMAVKGEETGYGDDAKEYWIVDPIDGTSAFIRGVPECMSMAAYVDGDEAIAGVIYDFVNDILYTAVKGEGAYQNGERMRVNEYNRKLEVDMHGRDVFSAVSRLLKPDDLRVHHPLGAAGSRMLNIASGKMDGYLHMAGRGHEHDFAPGILMALEAGAEIVSLAGESFSIHQVDRDFFVGTPEAAAVIRKNIEKLKMARQKYYGFAYLDGII